MAGFRPSLVRAHKERVYAELVWKASQPCVGTAITFARDEKRALCAELGCGCKDASRTLCIAAVGMEGGGTGWRVAQRRACALVMSLPGTRSLDGVTIESLPGIVRCNRPVLFAQQLP